MIAKVHDMRFKHYIGIDYSGANTPSSRLTGLQVYQASDNQKPSKVTPPKAGKKNWCRHEVAEFCQQILADDEPVIIGIDHGFSFPLSYMQRYGLDNWNSFLHDFVNHWPTAELSTTVEQFRQDNERMGNSSELRLCEQWTATAKSVFLFDVQGSVAKSTHAGLPWLLWLREMQGRKVPLHFWPFDGFAVPIGHSLIVEAYPALYKRRFSRTESTADEQDAYSIAAWLQLCDRRDTLEQYFEPPLTEKERQQARLEGWILGVY